MCQEVIYLKSFLCCHRLKDERTVCKLLEKLEKYIEKKGTTEEMCRLYIKRIEHIYYRVCITSCQFKLLNK